MFCFKKQYDIYGPQGGLSYIISLPKKFNESVDKCPMVILMHGFMSNKNLTPMPQIAKALANIGIASIRFDFNAHGNSEGRFIDMTIASEIEDAKAIFNYVCSLPYVTKIAFLGHSQGGVIAGMLAGELENNSRKPSCLIQIAPAAVLKDDAIAGQCMGKKYDATNPPEFVNVMFHKLGRKFILAAQKLPIYEISCQYTGNVCIVHGLNDKIVPISYSEKYNKLYKNSQMFLIEGEGHMIIKKRKEIISIINTFLNECLI